MQNSGKTKKAKAKATAAAREADENDENDDMDYEEGQPLVRRNTCFMLHGQRVSCSRVLKLCLCWFLVAVTGHADYESQI